MKRKQDGSIAYRPKRNGSMLVALVAKRRFASATTLNFSANTLGSIKTEAVKLILRASNDQTPGDSTMCTATLGSGSPIGMKFILARS